MRKTKNKVFSIGLSLCLVMATAFGCGKSDKSVTEIKGNTDSSANTVSTEKNSTSDSSSDDLDSKAEYEDKLFDTSYVHKVNIDISEEDWADLLANPLNKTKYEVNITIDGEIIEDVSFATKGNTSLSSIASDEDSDRYSFKVNFGKYVDGQTYYGLDKLNLNNIYADATYMKDYLSYELFSKVGVDSPLTSYIWLTINGEDYGLYLAIEDISDGYLERTDKEDGALYKPETSMLANMDKAGGKGDGNMPQMPDGNNFPGGGEMPDGNNFPGGGEMPDMNNFPGGENMPDGNNFPGGGDMPDGGAPDMKDFSGDGNNFPGGGNMPGGGFGNSNGADLKYTDDDVESYSDIFDNAENDVTDEDNAQVISALKKLSEGDIEGSIDTDEVIRYFVAHNFVLNYDSYTGNMLHNYYLYEEDGKLSMLPWDYNLAFGGFGGGQGGGMPDRNGEGRDDENGNDNKKTEAVSDATSLINTGIDSPLSGATEESRPMWSWIVSNDEYKEKYHEIYNQLLTDYFESGEFDKEIDALYEMLLPYVEKDPTAFYSVDEFKQAYSTLKEFCNLRASSIRAQLDGELSTVTSSQEESKKIDASSINVNVMGSQGKDKQR